MKSYIALVLAAAMGLTIPLQANAQTQHGEAPEAKRPAGHGDRMLRRLDLNGDGSIASAEAEAVGTIRFLRLDRDGDGAVTQDEMTAVAQERIARRIAKKFARLDQNGDGRVERAEFDERGAVRFVRLDADGDGRVSSEELRSGRHGSRHGHGGGYRHRWHDDSLPNE